MSEKNTGGPAFPVQQEMVSERVNDVIVNQLRGESGMTLRDYFAAKALQGLLAEPTQPGSTWFANTLTSDFTSNKETIKGERIAVAAYRLADAMLKAREA